MPGLKVRKAGLFPLAVQSGRIGNHLGCMVPPDLMVGLECTITKTIDVAPPGQIGHIAKIPGSVGNIRKT